MQPSSKRKHAEGPHKRIKRDEAELVPQTSPKCSEDMSQPPLPPCIPKTSTPNGTIEVSTTKIIITTVDTSPAPSSNKPTKTSRSQFRSVPEQTCSGVLHKPTENRMQTPHPSEDQQIGSGPKAPQNAACIQARPRFRMRTTMICAAKLRNSAITAKPRKSICTESKAVREGRERE